jgi:hypothetical protein
LSSSDVRVKAIRLGSNEVAVSYPPSLDPWFDGCAEYLDRRTNASKWVRLLPHSERNQFTVAASGHAVTSALPLGEALSIFWERVSFLLIDQLRDALVLHAAALSKDDAIVLLPGGTGSGKTRLSLWYREQGFDLTTDEVVCLGNTASADLLLAGALARPLLVKAPADLDSLLRSEPPFAQQECSWGYIIRLAAAKPGLSRPIKRALIVFPCFKPGTPLQLTASRPGEACLRLMENCLNARNCPVEVCPSRVCSLVVSQRSHSTMAAPRTS